MISNIALGLASLYFFGLHKSKNRYWAFFFLAMALAAFVGGIYHGYPELGTHFRFISWSLLSIALFFAQWAVFNKKINNYLLIFFLLKGVVLLSFAIVNADFLYMIIDSLISMFGFVILGNLIFFKDSYKLINIGIFISVISAIISRMEFTLHPDYMNHNDIGHYITIISLYLISLGVSNLEEKSWANETLIT